MDYFDWGQELFSNFSRNSSFLYNSPVNPPDKHIFIEVPLKGNRFEVPTFLIEDFYQQIIKETLNQPVPDCLVADVYSIGSFINYKSFDKIMKKALTDRFRANRLVYVEGKQADEKKTYFATKGALFDKDLNPLWMCLWRIEKRKFPNTIVNGEVEYNEKYFFTEPVIRIDPAFYFHTVDNVKRFTCKKILEEVHNRLYIAAPYDDYDWLGIGNRCESSNKRQLVIEIGRCPLQIKEVCPPSINTSNSSLLSLASEHMEDIA